MLGTCDSDLIISNDTWASVLNIRENHHRCDDFHHTIHVQECLRKKKNPIFEMWSVKT